MSVNEEIAMADQLIEDHLETFQDGSGEPPETQPFDFAAPPIPLDNTSVPPGIGGDPIIADNDTPGSPDFLGSGSNHHPGDEDGSTQRFDHILDHQGGDLDAGDLEELGNNTGGGPESPSPPASPGPDVLDNSEESSGLVGDTQLFDFVTGGGDSSMLDADTDHPNEIGMAGGSPGIAETQEFDNPMRSGSDAGSPAGVASGDNDGSADETLGFEFNSSTDPAHQSSLYDDNDDEEEEGDGPAEVDEDDRILSETQAFVPQPGEEEEEEDDVITNQNHLGDSGSTQRFEVDGSADGGMDLADPDPGSTQRFDIEGSPAGVEDSEEAALRAQQVAAAAATARVVVQGYSDDEEDDDEDTPGGAGGRNAPGTTPAGGFGSYETQRFDIGDDGGGSDDDENDEDNLADAPSGMIGMGAAGELNLDAGDFAIPENLDAASVPLSPEQLLESLKELEGEDEQQESTGAAYDDDAGSDVEEQETEEHADPGQILNDGASGSDPEVEDDDDDDDDEGPRGPGRKKKTLGLGAEGLGDAEDSDDDMEEGADEAKELIADIFGESDDEEGEGDRTRTEGEEGDEQFQGFAGEEDQPAEGSSAQRPAEDDSDAEDDQLRKKERPADFEYDFDVMLRQKREANRNRYRKRRGGVDFINDADDQISNLMQRMKLSAQQDREMNEQRLPAMHKRKLLHVVVSTLKKSDLQMQLIECGIMSCVAEWLSPLPDKSLPSMEVRTELFKILTDYPPLEPDTLRSSQIGKAVMYLYKHPKEIRENKKRASKLISEWARPIFNINTDFRSISKEDRQQRDHDLMSAKKRRRSKDGNADSDEEPPAKKEEPAEKVLRPGDKGWIGRARVPRPSTKDYVNRPKWNVDGEFKASKKSATRLDKKLREFNNRTKPSQAKTLTNMSVNGSRMNL